MKDIDFSTLKTIKYFTVTDETETHIFMEFIIELSNKSFWGKVTKWYRYEECVCDKKHMRLLLVKESTSVYYKYSFDIECILRGFLSKPIRQYCEKDFSPNAVIVE
jgi:hypothetical protein